MVGSKILLLPASTLAIVLLDQHLLALQWYESRSPRILSCKYKSVSVELFYEKKASQTYAVLLLIKGTFVNANRSALAPAMSLSEK